MEEDKEKVQAFFFFQVSLSPHIRLRIWQQNTADNVNWLALEHLPLCSNCSKPKSLRMDGTQLLSVFTDDADFAYF